MSAKGKAEEAEGEKIFHAGSSLLPARTAKQSVGFAATLRKIVGHTF